MNNKNTYNALLSRGFDNLKAKQLCENGHTVSRLQRMSNENLGQLGLTKTEISRIISDSRPPIPPKILKRLLYKSAFTCCVCRSKEEPVIIHHIDEWHLSRNHNEDNLVLLCLNCHDKAHSKKEISINLTPKQIRYAKKEWFNTVKQRELEAIFTKSSWNTLGGFWDYFNHSKITLLAKRSGVNIKSLEGYDYLYLQNLINSDGEYRWPTPPFPNQEDIPYMYIGGLTDSINSRLCFYESMIKALLDKVEFFDITNYFNKSNANALLMPNMIFSFTGSHRFIRNHKAAKGPGQMRTCYREANGLRIQSEIDAWESTSRSSYTQHLSGKWRCTNISVVRSITPIKGKKLIVNCSCLALGTGFTEHKGHIPIIAHIKESERESFQLNDGEEYYDDCYDYPC